MKMAIIGSRDFPKMHLVDIAVWNLPEDTEVVSGGARGVDRRAVAAAQERGLPYKEFFADWDNHGRGAGYMRNATVVNYADELMAFWDGKSKGTAHAIGLARDRGIVTRVIRPDGKGVIYYPEDYPC